MPDGSHDGFDEAVHRVLDDATDQAAQLGHRHLGTEHLLLGLMADPGDPAAQVLRRAGATPEGARSKIIEAVGRAEPLGMPVPTYTARAARALERATRTSLQRLRPMVGTDELLLGVLDVEGTAGQILRGLSVDVASLRNDVRALGQPDPREEAVAEELVAGDRTPTCGGCGAELERTLAHRPVVSTGPDGQRKVVAAFCSECGVTLAILAR